MQPHTDLPAKRGLAERAALISLVGLSVLSVLGVAVVTVYANRLSHSTDALERLNTAPAYVGRPEAVIADNGSSPMNVAILVADGSDLQAVVVANLSASRRSLTLITVPAQLTLDRSNSLTLAKTYAIDPTITVRGLEGLTRARMDHHVQLDLSCFAEVTGAGKAASAQPVLTAVASSNDTTDPNTRSTAAGELIRAGLITLNARFSPLDPGRYSGMVDAAAPCVKVDAELTSQVVSDTFMETSAHPEQSRIWPLTARHTTAGLEPSGAELDGLRAALSTPELSTSAQYQQSAFLPQEVHR